MELTQKRSKSLYVLRGLALFFIVLAHMPFGEQFPVADSLRIALSQAGVPVFFILSGYFYNRNAGDTKTFWLKKLKKVILPWLIIAISAFVLSAVLSKDFQFSILVPVKWVFGIGSVYWYMSVLIIMFIIFKYLRNDILVIVGIVVSSLSVVLSCIGVIKYNLSFNQYTNFFNWILFFGLGILLRKKDLLFKLQNAVPLCFGIVLFAVSLYFLRNIDSSQTYINYFSLPLELGAFVILLNLSSLLYKVKLLQNIGKQTLFIYLTHIQVAGMLNTRLPHNYLFFILRPFIVVFLLYFVSAAIKFILDKLKLSKYSYILAIN